MNEIMQKYLLSLKKVVNTKEIEELTSDDIFEINSFHAEKVYMIEEDDDYFLGIRANHFVIEEGFSEHHSGVAYLISANHKGIRMQTMLLASE